MKFAGPLTSMGIGRLAVLSLTVVPGGKGLASSGVGWTDNVAVPSPVLDKRDAYTCYGSDANITDCQAALDQLQPLGDQKFEVYSGICLNWSQDTCNVRFCAQPYVTKTVNRTASWIYHWANNTLMGCVRGGQYAVMGDSANLNGNGGMYRVHLEHMDSRHG